MGNNHDQNYLEPWTVFDVLDDIKNRVGILMDRGFILCGQLPRERKPYLRRAVACVNACAGIEDPAAEFDMMRAELASLRIQLGEAVYIARAVAAKDCESFCGVTDMKHACCPKRARTFLEATK